MSITFPYNTHLIIVHSTLVNNVKIILVLSFLIISFNSFACEPMTQGERYWPNPTKGDSRFFFDSIEVNLIKVTRGGPKAPCSDAGLVVFEVSYSEKNIPDIKRITEVVLSNIGIYFITKSTDEYGILPNIPMKAKKAEDGKHYISFAWVDHPPGKQKDINLEYDVKFISNRLNLSTIKSSGVIQVKGTKK